MTATQEFDLFIKFPLLQVLGELPLKIHIFETGPILGATPDLPEGSNQLLTFQSQLIGGGIVESGSIFSGSVYSNFNDNTTNKTVNVAPGGTYNQNIQGGGNINVKVGATVNIKVNGQQIGLVNTQGTGTANFATSPIPEPASWILFSMGIGILLLTNAHQIRKMRLDTPFDFRNIRNIQRIA